MMGKASIPMSGSAPNGRGIGDRMVCESAQNALVENWKCGVNLERGLGSSGRFLPLLPTKQLSHQDGAGPLKDGRSDFPSPEVE